MQWIKETKDVASQPKEVTDELLRRCRRIPMRLKASDRRAFLERFHERGFLEGWKLVTAEGKSTPIITGVPPKQYEIGKTTTLGNTNPLKPCRNGLHFTVSPMAAKRYIHLFRDARLFRVLATGKVCVGDHKSVATEITPVQEYTGADMHLLLT